VLNDLLAQLAQRESQLWLLMALDKVRDTLDSDQQPDTMFRAIASLLKQHFQADACAILLIENGDQETEVLVTIGAAADVARELCKQAMTAETPAYLTTDHWAQALGIRVALGNPERPMGGVFLARTLPPFDAADIELMRLAESQIDSAVIEARLFWKVAQRNAELEAIYLIDRLRDDNPDETHLIEKFTHLLVDRFSAELCLMMLAHVESGDMVVRSLVNRRGIEVSVLHAIRAQAGEINQPQVITVPESLANLCLLAAPLIVAGDRLGAIVVGRGVEFTQADRRLMTAIMSQIDSAIVHSRAVQQVSQRNKELEAIYRIDHIRDRNIEFHEMLNEVLRVLCQTIDSEGGYLMLYDEAQEKLLDLQTMLQPDLRDNADVITIINQFSRQALAEGRLVHAPALDGPIRSIVAVPLILNERIIGVFGALNSTDAEGFSLEDRRLLSAITSQADTAIFESLERRRMRKVLSRSVDPKVLDHLLERANDTILAGERKVLTVLFADLRGSTEWAERTEPEELVSTLNIFLGRMVDVIFNHGGTLDKFVGDEVIALFGTPLKMTDHALCAAQTALHMQQVHAQIRAEIEAQGRELPPMGIGISSGEVIAGEIGSPVRTDYTAMGRVMNLGARLCSAARPGQIVISRTTYDMIQSQADVQPLEPIALKGIGDQIQAYELRALKVQAHAE
jgi:class 3 adenylate cyclase